MATARRSRTPDDAPEPASTGSAPTQPVADPPVDDASDPDPAATAPRASRRPDGAKRVASQRRTKAVAADAQDAAAADAAAPETPDAAAAATTTRRRPRSGRSARRRAALTTTAPTATTHQRVAVVIPAKDESRRIAATVRAARAIPNVDLVLVVDDGSEDATQHVAREAGAVVVRHSHNRGKASAMETGAAVVAMRDVEDGPTRLLLFIDGDLGESAVNAAPLVPPVLAGETDATVALLPPQTGAGGRGIVVGLARRSIQSMTGWTPTQPLSGMRCLTRDAFEAAAASGTATTAEPAR